MRQDIMEALQAGKLAAMGDLQKEKGEEAQARFKANEEAVRRRTIAQETAQDYLALVEAFRELAASGRNEAFSVTGGMEERNQCDLLNKEGSQKVLNDILSMGENCSQELQIFINRNEALRTTPLRLSLDPAIRQFALTFIPSAGLGDVTSSITHFKTVRKEDIKGIDKVDGIVSVSGRLNDKTMGAIVGVVSHIAYMKEWITPYYPAVMTQKVKKGLTCKDG